MKNKFLLITLIQFWLIVNSLSSDSVFGKVTKVISGDTFKTDQGGKYKFYFLKAPDMKTKKGKKAKKELERLILNKDICASVSAYRNGFVFISDLMYYPLGYNLEVITKPLEDKKLLYRYRKLGNRGY